ncbi:MAG: ABC transporter substrate-binding protein [Gammaproteobacteria bacterium]|nr:ABC transporter substrate-binding protein [Gammaproteobacteria bacterium]
MKNFLAAVSACATSAAAIIRGMLVGAVLLAAGCGAPPSPPDELRVAMSTFSDGTFLPWNGSTGRKLYLDTIYEYLVYLDPETLAPQPGLAERWQMSPDGREVTLWLRRGVAFHGGWGEMTADDVAYTFNRMMDRTSIAGMASTLRHIVDRVEAIDTYTVHIVLKEPDIEFVSGYLSNGVVVPIQSRRYIESVGDAVANEHPIGTGPFRLVGYRDDTFIEVEAINEGAGNWRVKPDFKRIRFLSVPEEFTRAAMLKAGEVDLAPINYDSIDALAQAGVRTIFVKGNWAPVVRFGGLVQGREDPSVPWKDKRVRQALNYAVDKQAIVDYILHGEALITPGDFPVREWETLQPYPYDPAKARALLREAGYPNGFSMTLRTFTTAPGAEMPIMAEAVASYWRAIGVRTTIVPTTWTALRSAWSTGNASNVAFTHRGLAFAGALQGLIASSHSSNLFATFANDKTDAMISAIGAETDPARRAELIRQLGQYEADEAASVFIGFANEPYGVSPRVGHWPALSQQGTNVEMTTRATP